MQYDSRSADNSCGAAITQGKRATAREDQVQGETAMAPAQNCWEFRQCGREPGGLKVAEVGTCPAATDATNSGINRGKNGGRFCWAVTGTLCGGTVQGTYAQKRATCITCEFFNKVRQEEGAQYCLLRSRQEHKQAV